MAESRRDQPSDRTPERTARPATSADEVKDLDSRLSEEDARNVSGGSTLRRSGGDDLPTESSS